MPAVYRFMCVFLLHEWQVIVKCNSVLILAWGTNFVLLFNMLNVCLSVWIVHRTAGDKKATTTEFLNVLKNISVHPGLNALNRQPTGY